MKVTELPSASVADTLPIAVWFSAALKVETEVKTGELSFKLFTLIVISCVTEKTPSETVIIAVYVVLVS